MTPIHEGSPPRGLFRGTNFMTPTVLAYFKLRHGSGWAELSEGRGMSNQLIYGVTVRPDTTEPRRSKLFQSRSAAMDYIEELS
jgi:hypothetical protein